MTIELRRADMTSRWITQRQYEALAECRDSPDVRALLHALENSRDQEKVTAIMVDVIRTLAVQNKYAAKIALDALALQPWPHVIRNRDL